MDLPFRYSIDDIDPLVGKELLNLQSDGLRRITFAVYPNDDIIQSVESTLTFGLWIPVNYSSSREDVQIGILRSCIENNVEVLSRLQIFIDAHKNESRSTPPGAEEFQMMKISWLESNFAPIPLSVWFYTVKQLLKIEHIPVWFPPSALINKLATSYADALNLTKNSKTFRTAILSGSGRTRGKRPYMEDREFIFPSINVGADKTIGFFGVLDGHGGSECSQCIAEELPSKLTQYLRSSSEAYPNALFNTYISTDEWFLKSDRSGAGSTAVTLLWDQKLETVYIANTGDTRAVLCRGGAAFDLTKDRKASDPEEIARVMKCGGYISNGRVMGSLAITRAFGDKHLKKAIRTTQPGSCNISQGDYVTVEPEISIVDICSQDEFIIIATDGLWDVMSSQEAVNMTKELIKSQLVDAKDASSGSYVDLNRIADLLAKHAVSIGSMDNVTVMLLQFTLSEISDAAVPSRQRKVVHNAKQIMELYGTSKVDKQGLQLEVDTTPRAKSAMNEDIEPIIAVTDSKSNEAIVDDSDLMEFLLNDNNF